MKILLVCAAVLGMAISYDAGQRSVIDSCERVSFFHRGSKTFECLPYVEGVVYTQPKSRMEQIHAPH